jgi:hypothetical protein
LVSCLECEKALLEKEILGFHQKKKVILMFRNTGIARLQKPVPKDRKRP